MCPLMLFKLRPCIQKNCNVCYPPTPSLGWIKQIKLFTIASFCPERFLVSVFPASKKFDSDLELDAWMHKTDAHPWTIISHPCPPMNNNIAPMPPQNPWVGVGMGMSMGTQCRALLYTQAQVESSNLQFSGLWYLRWQASSKVQTMESLSNLRSLSTWTIVK